MTSRYVTSRCSRPIVFERLASRVRLNPGSTRRRRWQRRTKGSRRDLLCESVREIILAAPGEASGSREARDGSGPAAPDAGADCTVDAPAAAARATLAAGLRHVLRSPRNHVARPTIVYVGRLRQRPATTCPPLTPHRPLYLVLVVCFLLFHFSSTTFIWQLPRVALVGPAFISRCVHSHRNLIFLMGRFAGGSRDKACGKPARELPPWTHFPINRLNLLLLPLIRVKHEQNRQFPGVFFQKICSLAELFITTIT